MYRIKQVPEDFMVTEKASHSLGDGQYIICKITKKNWNTPDVVSEIARRLRIPAKNIGFAGNKDRSAVTVQFFSIKGTQMNKIKDLSIKDVEIEVVGASSERICLGDLEKNHFDIVVRNIRGNWGGPKPVKRMVNYYDEQRFSKNNVEVGRKLVQKKFDDVAELLKDVISRFEGWQSLREDNNNVGLLRLLPRKMLRFYVHSYQSWLWNSIAARFIKKVSERTYEVDYSLGRFIFTDEDIGDQDIDIPGFSAEYSGEIEEIADNIYREESISDRDFIIREMPEISEEGGKRGLFVEVDDLIIGDLEEDELNSGMKKCLISFSLNKGSYATLVIKNMLC